MTAIRLLVTVVSVALCFGVVACKKKDSGDSKAKKGDTMEASSGKGSPAGKGDSGKPKLSAADNPKVGDSCEGLNASAGVMACDGNIKMFCSSHSKYKWKKLGECKDGKKCVLGAMGKSISCK